MPLVFTDRYRSTVDLRIVWSEEEWKDYVDELAEASPRTAHVPGPPGVWPIIVATAFLQDQWVHEYVRLGHLRDYLRSLLDFTSTGPTLEEIAARQQAAEERLSEMAANPPAVAGPRKTALKIELED